MPPLFQLPPLASSAILLLAVIVALAVLYLLRPLAHKLIGRSTLSLYALLRLSARLLRRGGTGLWRQSGEIVRAQTRLQLARSVARNFARIGRFVEQGLGGYPSLEHRIALQVSHLEEDYQHSTLVPPPPPDWLDTVESVVNLQLKANHQPLVDKMLEDIRLMAEEQQRENLRHYRQSIGERHNLLKRMLPAWRHLSGQLVGLGQQLREISLRARQIDTHMAQLEQLEQTGQALDMRSQLSRLGIFAVAGGALALLAFAAGTHYQLLAAPLQQILASTPGSDLSLGSFSAGLWLGLQLLLGLVILEMLQITHLLPPLGQLTPGVRRTLIGMCLALLLTLALLGSLLVWNSGFWAAADNLGTAERNQAALALLLGSALTFILPLLLVLTAIPLEQCIDNLRPLAGYALGAVLLVSAGILHLLGIICRRSGPLLVLLYDLVISIPLVLERRWQGREKAVEPNQPPEQADRVSQQRVQVPRAVK